MGGACDSFNECVCVFALSCLIYHFFIIVCSPAYCSAPFASIGASLVVNVLLPYYVLEINLQRTMSFFCMSVCVEGENLGGDVVCKAMIKIYGGRGRGWGESFEVPRQIM